MSEQTAEYDSEELAAMMRVHVRTVRRWLRRWIAESVDGVRREKSPGSKGYKYLASAEVVARWKRCEPLTAALSQ